MHRPLFSTVISLNFPRTQEVRSASFLDLSKRGGPAGEDPEVGEGLPGLWGSFRGPLSPSLLWCWSQGSGRLSLSAS